MQKTIGSICNYRPSIILVAILLFSFLFINAQEKKDSILVVYFANNDFRVDSMGKANLVYFGSIVDSIISITGFADSIGSEKSNEILSKKRADAVYRFLDSLGIKINGSPKYKGEQFPQDAELYKNRKVEVAGFLKSKNSVIKQNRERKIIKELSIENILFVPDKAIITAASRSYIPQLAKQLQLYKGYSFEIIGHVNFQSNKNPNELQDLYKLSEARAKEIYLFMIDQGIPAEKLSYKGVGNSQPLIRFPKNDAEKMKNMRVQILVVSKE